MIRCGGITIDRKKHVVVCDGVRYRWRATRPHSLSFDLLCHHILGAGVSAEMCIHLLWGNDANGGPNNARNVVSVMRSRLSRDILPGLGLELRSWRLAGVTYYHICQKHQIELKRFEGSPRDVWRKSRAAA